MVEFAPPSLPEKKISTVTWVMGICAGLLVGIILSLFVVTPEKTKIVRDWVQGINGEPTPVETPIGHLFVPSIHVDSWVGNSLPVVTLLPPQVTVSSEPSPSVSTPIPTNNTTPIVSNSTTPSATTTQTPTVTSTNVLNAKHFIRKVLLIHVNPTVSCPSQGGAQMKLHQCTGWNDPAQLAPQVASFFKTTTSGHVTFNIVEEYTHNSFTEWTNGCFSNEYWSKCFAAGNCSRPTQCTANFTYTQSEFFACLNDPTHEKCLSGETNMKKLLATYGLPGKVNNGTIDEVWIYGAPWMSMWESQAIGPHAFAINSPPIIDNTYARTTVMMPMSYERDIGTSIHNFSHRFEATMGTVYGGWAENRINHSWDKFGLVKAQSPDFSYSGCGSGHYPPNAVSDYDYGNTTNVVATTCDTFYNYPDLSKYGKVKKNVTCTEWGCTEYGYFGWWMKHFPKYKGVGSDGKANDWWYYLLDLDNVFRSGAQVTSNQ